MTKLKPCWYGVIQQEDFHISSCQVHYIYFMVPLVYHGCRPDWHAAMHRLWLKSLLLVHCTGHTEARGNEAGKQAKQMTHLAYSLAQRRCGQARETLAVCGQAWETFWAKSDQIITTVTAWREEDWRRAPSLPSSEGRNVRVIWVQSDQDWHCFELNLQRSVYEPFWMLRDHLQLKLRQTKLCSDESVQPSHMWAHIFYHHSGVCFTITLRPEPSF